MNDTSINCDHSHITDIDSGVFSIEYDVDGVVYYITGLDVSWDFSILGTGSAGPEQNDEISFNYLYHSIEIQSDGFDIESDSEEFTTLIEKLGDISTSKRFEGAIIDYINQER